MGSGSTGGLSRRSLGVALLGIAGCGLVQSLVHLEVVLGADRIGTFVDLDRSNGLPDILSTIALAAAAAGAVALARSESGTRRVQLGALAAILGTLTLADLLHDGAHPRSLLGKVVIGLVLITGVLVVLEVRRSSARVRGLLLLAVTFLTASFLVTGLDRYDQWFERERGDLVREYEIVAKEGLELLGWSLVALALWDEAVRRRRAGVPTARASRAPAAPTRRAA